MWQVHDSRDVTAKAVSEILNKKELFIRKDPGSKETLHKSRRSCRIDTGGVESDHPATV